MTVPPTFRREPSEAFEPLTINVAKIRVMLEERRAEAALASNKVKALQQRLAKIKDSGVTFTPEQVSENLNLMSTFYTLEGRVQQLEELLADFEALQGNRDTGTKRPAAPTERPSPEKGFRL